MKHSPVSRSLSAAALFLITASLMLVGVSAGPGAAAPDAQLGSAIKIGKAAVSRPKFSEEDEERMAQAQAVRKMEMIRAFIASTRHLLRRD